MIPISLSIKGLYSYKEEQTIHFNELTSAGLFGIFGGVGSGKSTILEAITFALYNQTERLTKQDSRGYNMMNLQSDELKIEFECFAGDPVERYRFLVTAKRAKKKFKDVGTIERRVAKQMPDGQWMPLSDEKMTAEAIIGLSYDNFRRAIIIPQGRFQDFIELGGTERTRMMKEIFKLEKYELAPKVGVLIQQNNEKKATIEGSLLQLGTATPEELENTQQQKLLVHEQSVLVSQQVQQLELAVQAYKELQETEELLSKRIEDWQKIQIQKTQKVELQRKISLYEKASQVFGYFFIQKQERENELSRLQSAVQQLHQSIEIRKQDLAQNETKRTALASQIETIPAHKREVESLQKLVVIRGVEQEIKRLLQHQQTILQEKTQFEKELLELQTKRAELTEVLTQLSARIPTNFEQIVGDVRVWFTQLAHIETNKSAILAEGKQIKQIEEEQAQSITKVGTTLSSEFLVSTSLQMTDIDKIRDLIAERLHQHERIISELEIQLQNEKVKEKLQSFAHQLQDGEPCFLCGSTHHPAKITQTDQTVFQVEEKWKQQKNKREELREVQQNFLLAASKWQDAERQKIAIREKWEVICSSLDTHKNSFHWQDIPSTKNEFDAWVTANMQLVTKHKQTAESISAHQATIEQKTTVIQQINDTQLKENEQKVVAAQTQIRVLEEQMEGTSLISFASMSVAELASAIKQKEDFIKNSEEESQKLEKDYQFLHQEVETQKGILGERIKEIAQKQQDVQTIQIQISEALLNIPEFGEESEVRQVLQNWTLEEMKNAQQELHDFLSSEQRAKIDLDEIKEKKQQIFGDLTYDAQRQEQLHTELGKVKETQQELLQEQGKLVAQIDALTQQLAQKTSLLQQFALINKRGEDLKILESMFRSSGFVNYISKIYLENLCQVANERFSRMTRQQLELTLGEDNAFWVRDMLNGGHLRLLKTLSGGQKFQAALSLALALADSIHSQQKMANNFFFIDEGFGSLDKGSLQIVFEALKSLRRENRIVGVISHVEELQQEIQTYLSISNTEEGSRVFTSWEAN